MQLPIGTNVDEYRIAEPIAVNRRVDVYRAAPVVGVGPDVALHLLRQAILDGDPAEETLEDLGLELCRFSHDAFPEVVDYGRFMVRPYFVTELVEGRSLAEIIEAGELTSEQCLGVLASLHSALHAAHSAGITHGSLRADSIVITATGDVKVIDLCAHALSKADAREDLLGLVELSRQLMKNATRVAKATVQPPALPPPDRAPTPVPVQIVKPEPPSIAVTIPTSAPTALPPPPVPLMRPPMAAPAQLSVRLPPPVPRRPPPPPPAPLPRRQAPLLAVRIPSQPPRARTPVPRYDSFDAPLAAASLRPGYVDFFRGFFSGATYDAPRVTGPIEPGYVTFFRNLLPNNAQAQGDETSAARAFNLAMVCVIGVVTLFAVLHL